ncbi:hypothetical protein B0O99DRAFT_748482 [Bisporella sp. PMI_857]|nr:hypothetical protein B0O99DRAFT_748482 [Bisporella sp. PMI_857]
MYFSTTKSLLFFATPGLSMFSSVAATPLADSDLAAREANINVASDGYQSINLASDTHISRRDVKKCGNDKRICGKAAKKKEMGDKGAKGSREGLPGPTTIKGKECSGHYFDLECMCIKARVNSGSDRKYPISKKAFKL